MISIDDILNFEAGTISLNERQFSIFGYNTIFHDKKINELKKNISKERALFPSMNPNLFGGLPSIFSCKPELRVSLKPGDVIFCFPNKSTMKDYFIQIRKQDPPDRCLTLVFIVIKKIPLKSAHVLLSFKACRFAEKIKNDENLDFISFAGDLKQAGDITAKYKDGIWEYAGEERGPHFHNQDTIKIIHDGQCKYGKYLSKLAKKEDPKYSKLGCLSLKCKYYRKECKMESGNWKYDILFKWGLLGSLKKSIPLEFRSFYFGSKGWSLKKFAEEVGVPKILENARWYKKDLLNEKGPEILNKLRIEYKIE